MSAHPRNNKTASGAKRRWTTDDRDRRDQHVARGRGGAPAGARTDRSSDVRPRNARPTGERSSSARPAGDAGYSARPANDRSRDERRSGDRPFRDRPAGDRAQSNRTTGERTTGERTTGERTTGDRTTGDRTTGDRGWGERAQGSRNARYDGGRSTTDRGYGGRGNVDRSARGAADRQTGRGDRDRFDRDRAGQERAGQDRTADGRGGKDRRQDWYPGPRDGGRGNAPFHRGAAPQRDERGGRPDRGAQYRTGGDQGRRTDDRPERGAQSRDGQTRGYGAGQERSRTDRGYSSDARGARLGGERGASSNPDRGADRAERRSGDGERAPWQGGDRGYRAADRAERPRDYSRSDDSRSDDRRSEQRRAPGSGRPDRGSADRSGFTRSGDPRQATRGFDARGDRGDARTDRARRDGADRTDRWSDRSSDRRTGARRASGAAAAGVTAGYLRRDRDTAPHRAGQHGRHDHDHGDRAAAPWAPPEDVVLDKLDAEVETADALAGATFQSLGLGDRITEAVQALGADKPFAIQAATIPDALAGRNVLGRARTGSGKTIAFGAALVERLMRNWTDSGRAGTGRKPARAPRALILAPTRELAYQIDRTVQPIARSVGLFTTQIVGGVPQARQVGALQKGVDIVIGTPGRIEDLIEQGRLRLDSIEITVLDEADHMAELGFLEPMQRILSLVPAKGQRLLFSATLDTAVSSLVQQFLPNPAVHEIADDTAHPVADHHVLVIEQGAKFDVLETLLASGERSLVFVRTRAFAEELAEQLEDAGVRTVSLHGDLNQTRRSRNLERFADGRVTTLVATDVAARGIHVDDIAMVVHADAAEEYKTYLHRSGRTGRAGANGTVVTLINPRRRRRMTELLERAEVEATFTTLRPGEDPLQALGR